jgi:hypothetical protein
VEPALNQVNWSLATPRLVRGALLVLALWGMSSDIEAVSSVSGFVLFGLLPSFLQLLRRRQPRDPRVLTPGNTRIVLQQATWRDWGKIKRILHDDLNLDYSTARDMFGELPVTLEPALARSQAEEVVARLGKAGALTSMITIDPASAPEQLSGGPALQP